jgi:hypothetical protein
VADQRNAGREIAISLLVAAVGGALVLIYLLRSTTMPVASVLIAHDGGSPTMSDLGDGARIASAFVEHLGAERFEEAYALMSSGYRARASVADFRRAWSSPLLAAPKRVRLSSSRAEALRLPDGGFARPIMFTGRGVMTAAAGTFDIQFTFLREQEQVHVLAVLIGGIMVVQGVTSR